MSVLKLRDGALVDARVDDELWTNARVPLADLPAAERGWLTSVAARVIAALAPRASLSNVRFESDGALVRIAATSIALSPDASADLEMFLDAVQGALLLDDDARGLTKRSRGDSPV